MEKTQHKWNQKHRPQGEKEQRKALSIWRDQRINNHAHASTQASTREHSTLNIHASNPEPRNEEIETENERENARLEFEVYINLLVLASNKLESKPSQESQPQPIQPEFRPIEEEPKSWSVLHVFLNLPQ